MNEQLTLLMTGCGLLALVTLVSVADSSLRAFSRSRLEAICSERGRPELFGIILARRERVQLAVNCLFALSLVAAAAVCVIWWLCVFDSEICI